jgi:hypothetical protein
MQVLFHFPRRHPKDSSGLSMHNLATVFAAPVKWIRCQVLRFGWYPNGHGDWNPNSWWRSSSSGQNVHMAFM